MNPNDYDLPHDEWRPHQKEALDLILNMHNASTMILEMPTGTGKTGICAATGYKSKVLSMMGTRELQQQYADIYDFSIIWGRSHYPCTDPIKANRWKKVYGFLPNAGDCTKMKECDVYCPYKQAKSEAFAVNKVATNYHYGWYSEWWHKRDGYLFCDEAHNLAISVISGLAQLKVSEKQREKWDLPKFPAISGATLFAKDAVDKWLEQSIGLLGFMLGQMEDSKKKSRGTLLHRKLVMLRQLLYQGSWYIEGRNYGTLNNPPLLSCRPINPSVFADRLLGHHDKRVLMSATIGDAEMLARELGINDYEFHSFPHNIPLEQRPVFLVEDSPAMSYRSTYKDYEHQADIVAHLCHKHKSERVLIHCTRWRHAHDLANRLSRKGLQDRVYVPNIKEGRLAQIAKLTVNTKPDLIAIGPSFWEGLDLRDDLCRAVIICKVPFQDRKDPVVAARLRQEGGQAWDRWVASMKVVQGVGRAVRDKEDYAVGYIVDNNWIRVQKYAPKWFNVQ